MHFYDYNSNYNYNYNPIKYIDGDLVYGMGSIISNYINNVDTFGRARPYKKESTMYQYAVNIKEPIKYNFFLQIINLDNPS